MQEKDRAPKRILSESYIALHDVASAPISHIFFPFIFSWSLNRLIFAAAAVFVLSDCFMVLNNVMNAGMFLKILALLVYYGSLLLYGIVIWKE